MARKTCSPWSPGQGPPSQEEEAELLLRERFVFRRVWRAFQKLEGASRYVGWVMVRSLYGVVIDPIDQDIRPVRVKHGVGAGPYWVWNEFPQLSGAQLVSIHPVNGCPPYIMDFAIPNSTRSFMSMFEARVPPGFDPSI